MAPRPDRETIRRHMEAVPIGAIEGDVLNERAAQAAIYELDTRGSLLRRHLSEQALAIIAEELPDLPSSETTDETHYTLTEDQLISLVHKGVLRGAMQALCDSTPDADA